MRVRLLLTDGRTTVDYVWLEHDGTDVYLGAVGSGAHFSYHASGQSHVKTPTGEKAFITQRAPLTELSGFFELTEVVVSRDVLDHPDLPKYGGGRSDANLLIDMRSFPRDRSKATVTLGLLEPGQLDELPITTPGFHTQLVVVVTGVTPWVCAVLGWPVE